MSVPPASSHLSNSEKTLGLALLPFSRSSLDPTLLSSITPHANSLSYPIYYSSAPSLIPGVSDRYTALAVPIVAYWVLGGLFHLVDVMQWEYFEKRRIHESEEVLQRNRVSMPQLIKAVVFQHVLQTILGLLWIDSHEHVVDHAAIMAERYVPRVAQAVMVLLGPLNGETVLRNYGSQIVQWTYWWAVPFAQFALAFFIIDTWQFFLHKAMHEVSWLYRNFHSHHHRLYVPYAFGALYNHPIEGLLLDSAGAAIAEAVSGMTIRQTVLLFGFSSLKTVDDHSGYRIWWDPMQILFANNADFHDIHHQSFGIKKNFSQPFFTRWDHFFGSVMTREEVNNRKRPVGSNEVAEILAVEKQYKIE